MRDSFAPGISVLGLGVVFENIGFSALPPVM